MLVNASLLFHPSHFPDHHTSFHFFSSAVVSARISHQQSLLLLDLLLDEVPRPLVVPRRIFYSHESSR